MSVVAAVVASSVAADTSVFFLPNALHEEQTSSTNRRATNKVRTGFFILMKGLGNKGPRGGPRAGYSF